MSNVVDLATARAARHSEIIAVSEKPSAPNQKRSANRSDVWREASMYLAYLEARRSLGMYARIMLELGLSEAEPHSLGISADYTLLDQIRQARASLLTTPAPTKAELTLKRRIIASPQMEYLPIARARAERAVQADEEYLATDPYKRGARRRAGQQSCEDAS